MKGGLAFSDAMDLYITIVIWSMRKSMVKTSSSQIQNLRQSVCRAQNVSLVHHNSQGGWPEVLASAKSFVFLNFRHVSKDFNIAAHEPTKLCSMFDIEFEYFGSFLDRLTAILLFPFCLLA